LKSGIIEMKGEGEETDGEEKMKKEEKIRLKGEIQRTRRRRKEGKD
jgi:hypothetical protein